ncbi:MAG TPA: G5 domain-containing protein [Anaerolineales bacterium]|nr:G5 domain-containing protein [Anaerolineales bacterium]
MSDRIGLYQRPPTPAITRGAFDHSRLALVLVSLAGMIACAGPRTTAGEIAITIEVDGRRQSFSVPSGSTVQQALQHAGVELGELDRVTPPGYTVLTAGSSVSIIRASERFEVETVVLPFERQTIRNEALPEGETRLLQPGENGEQEITYRIVEEAGQEISRTRVKEVVTKEAVPEIVMVGAQAAYTPLPIEGTLAYLSGGNAWVVQRGTANRQPLVVTGDLDGRVLKLSPDGRWLLFTRHTEEDEGDINSLWVISTTQRDPSPIALRVSNIVHFADWSPVASGSTLYTIAFSTVEPRSAAPGWQANNDLQLITFASSGRVIDRETLIPENAGGQYGWWGTGFSWSPSGTALAYARADSVGLIDLGDPAFEPLTAFAPLQTLGDWAWVPGVAWGAKGDVLYLVAHGSPLGIETASASPVFNLATLSTDGRLDLTLVERTGMFANPSVSPAIETEAGEDAYRVSFLQASTPLDSESSFYRISIIDRDGSNRITLFPAEGEPGLAPKDLGTIAWSPNADRFATVYRGDLWLIDVATGIGQRITGDGQTTAYDWKE